MSKMDPVTAELANDVEEGSASLPREVSEIGLRIREASHGELEAVIPELFRNMWKEYQVPEDGFLVNADQKVTNFFEKGGSDEEKVTAFVYESDDGTILGCAVCQLFQGLYPLVLKPTVRKYGYIWGVYVIPSARRRGLAGMLTQTCVDCLTKQGCTKAILHASPHGKSLYSKLGFQPSNEMSMVLPQKESMSSS